MSTGSSNHSPALPFGAAALTLAAASMFNLLPEVSINPPSPPNAPPFALMLPLTRVKLSGLFKSAISVMLPPCPALSGAASACMLPLWLIWSEARSRMRPPSFTKPLACKLPVLFTMPPCKLLAACADKMISPPGACTALPFSTKVFMVAGVTTTLDSRPLPSNCKV